MIRKILAINGGGITDVAYLTYMLKISKHYDKKNIDILNLFNTFSGVSSGSIIASSFVLREKFLQNIAKRDPDIIASALKKINAEYSKNEILNIIKNLKKMTITNCSSIVIATLLKILEKEGHNIFNKSTLRKIASMNGLLFSKYNDNKKRIFDKYIDFTLKNIPADRTLVIKAINIKKIKVQIYTNYVTSTKNNFLVSDPDQSISQAVDFSSNAPTFFPFNQMVDGSIILNTSLLEQIFIFKNDDLVIFKLSNIIKPHIKNNIVFDGILGWTYPLIKLSIIDGFENEILKDLIKFKYQEKFHISEFDLTTGNLDDVDKIEEFKKIGEKKSFKSSLEFIDKHIIINFFKLINTWKDTWNLIKIESKNDGTVTDSYKNGLNINYKFTDDNKLYILNNITNGETEIYSWSYDNMTRTLFLRLFDTKIENKIVSLYDNELIIQTEDSYFYFKKIINYNYIGVQLTKTWTLIKQERSGIDITDSLNYSLTMKLNYDTENTFIIHISTNSKDPTKSEGILFVDVDYNELIFQLDDLSSENIAQDIRYIIVSLTENELKLMQKINNEEILNTYKV
jgi:hypothetical protein